MAGDVFWVRVSPGWRTTDLLASEREVSTLSETREEGGRRREGRGSSFQGWAGARRLTRDQG